MKIKTSDIISIGAIVVLLIFSGFWLFTKTNNNQNAGPEGIILFYGDGCSHCKIVEDFILQNKIEDKVKFTRLEVWNNKDNAYLLAQKAATCGIKTTDVGIPFVWDGNTCIFGDDDKVINFFKNAANIK
jgi:hypothetical protein